MKNEEHIVFHKGNYFENDKGYSFSAEGLSHGTKTALCMMNIDMPNIVYDASNIKKDCVISIVLFTYFVIFPLVL